MRTVERGGRRLPGRTIGAGKGAPVTPVIFGLAGPELRGDERALFAAVRPAGYILFGRNIIDAAQVGALTAELQTLGAHRPIILIDQEGGAVARLKPPAFPAFPPASDFAALYTRAPLSAIAAARANGQLLGATLSALGLNANAAPVLDLCYPATHAVLASRCLGDAPTAVAALGRALMQGMAEYGVAAILKHLPGQGRAVHDSHVALPIVDVDAGALARDIAPFAALAGGAPAAMVAHIVYPAWDGAQPASASAAVISQVIRGEIGFDGLLMSDAIEMAGLAGLGDMAARARAVITAGCDVALHCTGDIAQMRDICDAIPMGTDSTLIARLNRVTAGHAACDGDMVALAARRDALLGIG